MPHGHVKGELTEFDRKFDLISVFGVLEHVEDPKQLLTDIASHLAPGGKAIISVPNPHSLQLSLFGKDWYNWIAPRHFNLMPIKALRSLSESCGFEVVGEKHFFLRTNSGSFALSMFPSLDPLKKGPAWRLLAYAALFYGLIPAELILSALGAGGFMGVVLQKKP